MIAPPIYLVCACTSGEEFVAAFRRYADKGGIFVPIAEPIPANRRGRFALVLRDGSVMIEGDAEIVASSKSPSPLYGRVGMTIRFVEPDEASKAVLADLDRARLATKVAPLSVAPRPTTDVPAAPRPVTPTASGRIDAANALAETVAIGDLASLKDLGPPKAGPKFVIPAIPSGPAGSARGKTPSTFPLVEARTATPNERTRAPTAPPALVTTIPPRAKTGTVPPAPFVPTTKDTQPVAVVPPPRHDPADRRAGQSSVLPSLESLKVGQTQAVAVVPPPALWAPKNLFENADDAVDTDPSRADGATPEAIDDLDDVAPAPSLSTPTSITAQPEPPPSTFDAQPPSTMTPTATLIPPAEPMPMAPRMPAGGPPSLADLVRSAAANARPRVDANPTLRGTSAPARPNLAALEVDEKTDLTSMPDIRMTAVGLGVPPVHDTEMIAAEAGVTVDVELDGNDRPTTQRPVAGPTIEEPTPSGNWTMTPDGAIEVLPTKPVAPPPAAPAADDGDWTITPDQDAPVYAPAAVAVVPAPSPRAQPKGMAPKTKVIQAVDANDVDQPTEPKVQIDPTLMDHAMPLPAPPMPMPPVVAHAPAPMPGMMMAPAAIPTPHPGVMMQSAMPSPQAFASSSGASPIYPTPMHVPMAPPMAPMALPMAPPMRPLTDTGAAAYYRASDSVNNAMPVRDIDAPVKRRRWLVIILSTITVIALGVGVLWFVMHDNKTPPPKVPVHAVLPAEIGSGSGGSGSGSGSASAEIVPVVVVDAGVPASADAASTATAECSVDVVTAPPGVDILDEKDLQIGVSPQKLVLPCGPARLGFRKATYAETARNVVATAAGAKLRVALGHATFSVKVSSTPAGASISVGGKPKGFTPTTVQLPMLETSTIVFAKDGFAGESEKITPRQNNQAVHVTLKKKPQKLR